MLLAAIIFCLGMGYFAMGGLACGITERQGRLRCSYSSHSAECNHMWVSGLMVPFWPVALPVILGLGITGVSSQTKATVKTQRQRQAEISEAKHNLELAELRAAEDAILNKQLAAAGSASFDSGNIKHIDEYPNTQARWYE